MTENFTKSDSSCDVMLARCPPSSTQVCSAPSHDMGVVTLGMPYLNAPCCVHVYWYGLIGANGGGGDMAHPYQPHAGVGGLGGGGGGKGGGGLGGGSGGGGASGILELTSKLPESP